MSNSALASISAVKTKYVTTVGRTVTELSEEAHRIETLIRSMDHGLDDLAWRRDPVERQLEVARRRGQRQLHRAGTAAANDLADVPDQGRGVLGAAGQATSVPAKGQGTHRAAVTRQQTDLPPLPDAPEPNTSRPATRRQSF